MSEFTKGKWSVNGTVIQGENGYPIAQVWPNTKLSSDGSTAQMKANARLIAAAPKLLEACKFLLNYSHQKHLKGADWCYEPQKCDICKKLKEAKAAIAAATD